MMQTNPSTTALFDVILKGGLGFVAPAVRRIIKLNKDLILGEEGLVELIRIFKNIHRKMLLRGGALEPFEGRHDEGFMLVSAFRQNQGAKSVCLVSSEGW